MGFDRTTFGGDGGRLGLDGGVGVFSFSSFTLRVTAAGCLDLGVDFRAFGVCVTVVVVGGVGVSRSLSVCLVAADLRAFGVCVNDVPTVSVCSSVRPRRRDGDRFSKAMRTSRRLVGNVDAALALLAASGDASHFFGAGDAASFEGAGEVSWRLPLFAGGTTMSRRFFAAGDTSCRLAIPGETSRRLAGRGDGVAECGDCVRFPRLKLLLLFAALSVSTGKRKLGQVTGHY